MSVTFGCVICTMPAHGQCIRTDWFCGEHDPGDYELVRKGALAEAREDRDRWCSSASAAIAREQADEARLREVEAASNEFARRSAVHVEGLNKALRNAQAEIARLRGLEYVTPSE